MRHVLSGHTKRAASALVAGAPAAPTVAAQSSGDLRSPDARELAARVQARQDLRSADARDTAQGRATSSAPQVVVVKVARPQGSGSSGFDWADAGIGAGAVLGLILLGVGGALVVAHRGRARAEPSGRTAIAG
jgi:hypothetical protein